jgi:hypothetical protein
MDVKQYIKELSRQCEPLFVFSENNVKKFFDKKPDNQELIDYFVPRMMNERMNCTLVAQSVADADDSWDGEKMMLHAKQVLDEAKHFKMLIEILEHLNGGPIDVPACMSAMRDKEKASHEEGGGLRPAHVLAKWTANKDPLALALYQFIGEGRAARNWDMIAKCADDTFLANQYAKIARDEKFHFNIGKKELENLITEENVDRANTLANAIIDDLMTLGLAKRYYVDPSLVSLNSCPKSIFEAA